jgi:phosphonate transport system substrate-binding protein
MIRRDFLTLVALAAAWPARGHHSSEVRFGLTPVVLRENVRFFDRFADYIGQRINHPVRFVRTRSYQEVIEKLRAEELEFAWVCGYPLVQKRDPEFLELLSVPIFQGEPLYQSYIIVHKDSPFRTLDELKGQVFAYSDPNSNSGYLYPRFALTRRGYRPEQFFRLTFFTYNHAETVEAVAEQVAQGGAVESYIWTMIDRLRPELTAQTKVIERSPSFGFPPVVAHVGTDSRLRADMAAALTDMDSVPAGRALLEELGLDGFGEFPITLFDDIAAMAGQLGRTSSAARTGMVDQGG